MRLLLCCFSLILVSTAQDTGCSSLQSPGSWCELVVNSIAQCANLCAMCSFDAVPLDGGRFKCILENLLVEPDAMKTAAHAQLAKYLSGRANANFAPNFRKPKTDELINKALLVPMGGRMYSLNEKEKTVEIMMVFQMQWYDPRLAWDSGNFSNISHIYLARDLIWRPPLLIERMISFSIDSATPSNVEVSDNGTVLEYVVCNVKLAAKLDFHTFPYDSHDIDIVFMSPFVELRSPNRLMGEPFQSSTEWKVTKQLYRAYSKAEKQKVSYKLKVKRYPYFWTYLIIGPCFALGSLVVAALTLSANSSSMEALVNIGLAMTVASSVVISSLQSNFPKTKDLPSLATFVRNQLLIILVVLITVTIRKVVLEKMKDKLKEMKKDKKENGSTPLYTFIVIVKHRCTLLVVFELAHVACFIFMMRHSNLDFTVEN